MLEECAALRVEIKTLHEKFDNLLKTLANKKDISCQDFSCQTDFIISSPSSLAPPNGFQTLTSSIPNLQFSDSPVNVPSSVSTLAPLSVPTLDTSLTAIQDDVLMDIFLQSSKSLESANDLTSHQIPPAPLIVLPCIQLPNAPFKNFDFDKLDQDTSFEIKLKNRSLCYYGLDKYSYNGLVHEPKPIPLSGNYICSILDHIKTILPDYAFNSILITKYQNGSDFLGFHSDNESEIVPNSDIVTLSFGESRIIKFKTVSTTDYPSQEVTLNHGDALIMSQQSQNFFQHSILPDDSDKPRISITLCMLGFDAQSVGNSNLNLNESVVTSPVVPEFSTQVLPPSQSTAPDFNRVHSEKYSLYIGDSLIKHIRGPKMSSSSQRAAVFAYPGATAGGIHKKLRTDPEFLKLDPTRVDKVFVVGGSNNIDKVLNIPFHMNSNFVDHIMYQKSEHNIKQAKTEIDQLVLFLLNRFQSAKINFVNILPRVSSTRNNVINLLNEHIHLLTSSQPNLCMVSTELNRNLFVSRDGHRKDMYFSHMGDDNVHLNDTGIVRLAKHLKYIAHNDSNS